MRLMLPTLVLLLACGGNAPSAEVAPIQETAVSYQAPRVQGEIDRGILAGVLERGLARFLQGIVVEPHLEDGVFIGHRIVTMYPDDPRFTELDLQPGDTVVRINGNAIERPEQAYEVWTSLRVSSQLLVDYLHDGEPRTLRFSIN